MADTERSAALRTIFSVFLGLMLTAFVGVGVYTFHPPPDSHDSQIRDLARREQEIRNRRPPDELTTEDRDRIEEINRQRNELIDAAAEARRRWRRSTSVILIVFATLAMAVSLVRADQLPVISNGLLLGGVFTMLYGVGWIVATDRSITRFLVITVALVITFGTWLCSIRSPRHDAANQQLDRESERARGSLTSSAASAISKSG